MKALTKIFAFFMKEFHDVRRQPRLLLSLVDGPLLVLAAFGATFCSANPFITAALVWPENACRALTSSKPRPLLAAILHWQRPPATGWKPWPCWTRAI